MLLQIIPIVSRSPVPFYGPSIAFTDHSYRLQVTCTFLRTSIALQILSIVSRSPVPFYGPSNAFTDHSYRLQVTCTFSRTIHCFYRSFLSFTGHPYLLRTIHCFYRSFLSSPDHLYLSRTIHSFNRSFLSSPGHLYLLRTIDFLQIIPIVSMSPVPFYGSSVALTDTFHRLQVTCTFLRSIHSFYRFFLSSLDHLYLFTDHP